MTTKPTEASARPCPDWRDPESYAYTRALSRDAWAWEFLRRNPRYRTDYSRVAGAFRTARPARVGVLAAVVMSEAALRWGLLPF